MAYPIEHWEEVAKRYKSVKVLPEDLTGAKTEESVRIAKVQDSYPYSTYGTIAVWIKRCRKEGLI
jgi:hypothetical protein